MEPPSTEPQPQPPTTPAQPAQPAPPPATPVTAPPAPATTTTAADPGTGIFRGRLGRLGYLMFLVYVLAACLALGLLVALLTAVTPVGSAARSVANVIAFLFGPALLIFCIVFGIGVSIRRWHDIGQSGWFILLSLIPVVSFVVAILMFVLPGTAGPNKYGPPNTGGTGWRSVLGLKSA